MAQNLVIIPTYNEKENIESLILAVFSLEIDFHILVVDDNSPDGTANLVINQMETHPNKLFLVSNPKKNGLGNAYIKGFEWALEKEYAYIFEMDADFSHMPNDLPALLKPCLDGIADISIGSRYVNGVTVINWPLSRILLSYFASLYVRIITGMPTKDSTAGFICYNRKVLEKIDLKKVKQKGYGFQIEMKYKAYKKGARLLEVPVIFRDRTRGTSKLDGSIIFEAIFGVIELRWKEFFGIL